MDGSLEVPAACARDDRLTVAALAAVAYVLSMLAHEALGRGGACMAAGGQVTTLWALDLPCDLRAFAGTAADVRVRAVAAAGPLIPLVLGGALLTWLHARVGPTDCTDGDRDALAPLLAWLAAAFLLLPNLGYFCLAVAHTGDSAIALSGAPAGLPGRILVVALGAVLYWLTARTLFRLLGRMTSAAREEGWRRGRDIAWSAYAVAAVLAFGAAARQTEASSTVGLSGFTGAAASLAGTSGLLWGARALRRPPARRSGWAWQPLARHPAVIAGGVMAALAFVGILAPGVRLR